MPSPGITKRYLAQAIKTLMADRPLSKISVGDIVEYCGLNRNSFYYHFRDKYDLVNWIFYTEIVTKLREQQGELTSGWALIEKICEYLYDEKDFYVSALSETGQDSFPAYFSQVMRTMVLAHAEEMEEESREFAGYHHPLAVRRRKNSAPQAGGADEAGGGRQHPAAAGAQPPGVDRPRFGAVLFRMSRRGVV